MPFCPIYALEHQLPRLISLPIILKPKIHQAKLENLILLMVVSQQTIQYVYDFLSILKFRNLILLT